MVGELFKLFGPYQDLYYPYKSSIIGQFILIAVLYIPFFVNYHMVRRLINTNIRLRHPGYNFETGKITVQKHDVSPSEWTLTGSVGGYRTHARSDEDMEHHRETIQSNEGTEEQSEEFYRREEENKVSMFPPSNRGTREISDDDKKAI